MLRGGTLFILEAIKGVGARGGKKSKEKVGEKKQSLSTLEAFEELIVKKERW